MKRVLFVCLGNICRSPTLEAVARLEWARAGLDVEVASAGTADYHVGRGADPRSIAVAEAAGYAMAAHRARQVHAADFCHYDLILAMDRANLRGLELIRPADASAQVGLLLSLAAIADMHDVPDPYYGGQRDFEQVLDLARRAVAALATRLD